MIRLCCRQHHRPEAVLLGGTFTALGDDFAATVRDRLNATALSARWPCDVRPAALGADATLIGAASLALDGVLADPSIVPARPTTRTAEPEATMSDHLAARPEHKFTFGLWTVGNPGRDPFGREVRPPLDPVESVRRLAELGVYGVTFHDDDLVPPGSTPTEREAILKRFRTALDETGTKVPMATVNLFSRPVFKEGAFTANDPSVRRFAVRKALDAIDLGAELGAGVFVLWGGREGVEADAAKDVRGALDRYKEAVDLCCEHIRERGYDLRIALEPKPNEPRGDIFLPTVGHALAFIGELEWPDMVGLNPEFAHETMSGLNFTHGVAQALWQGKLFHIDLNAQRIGKFDQDFRFGSEGIRDAFYLVRLLEDSGWDGMRHFDAHAYRTEDADGVWQFAEGCMRTYLILKEKAERMRDDAEIREALHAAKADQLSTPTGPLDAVRSASLDEDALAAQGYGHERLDQLVTELLLGVR